MRHKAARGFEVICENAIIMSLISICISLVSIALSFFNFLRCEVKDHELNYQSHRNAIHEREKECETMRIKLEIARHYLQSIRDRAELGLGTRLASEALEKIW